MAWYFHTPGNVDKDLPKHVQDAWNDWHVCEAAKNLAIMRQDTENLPGELPYANPATEPTPEAPKTTPVAWDGYPKRIQLRFGDGPSAWIAAEDLGSEDLRAGLISSSGAPLHWPVRHRQDEYLEWAERRENGKLVSVTFVAEGYDYWAFLFQHDPTRVVEAFRSSTNNANISERDLIASDDIFIKGRPEPLIRKGTYNWRHSFNQGPGILHLSHAANSLGAEINLAVTSSLGRVDSNGELLDTDDPAKLLCCTNGGNPNRSSDPLIGAAAYRLVNASHPSRFTLTDPIGLYIRSFHHEALTTPDGELVGPQVCTVQRGEGRLDRDPENARVLRMTISAPNGSDFALGDMFLDGELVTHGAQLAGLVKMHLFVDFWPASGPAPRLGCSGTCIVIDQDKDLIEAVRPPIEGGAVVKYPDLLKKDDRHLFSGMVTRA